MKDNHAPTRQGTDLAAENWDRYRYALWRGHRDYVIKAQRLEQFYLGGGEQWSENDKAVLAEQNRAPLEFNEIMPAINSAVGYQIHNRMDITCQPRSVDTDQPAANTMSKVLKQISDNNRLHWHETQVLADGLIEQRGYFDVRLDWSESMTGEIQIRPLDPRDVVPDPDAKHYDPDQWTDVIITRWCTADEIGQLYGDKARRAVEQEYETHDSGDFGELDDGGAERNKFGSKLYGAHYQWDSVWSVGIHRRYRVIDRQYHRYEMVPVGIYPTGDIRVLDQNQQKDTEGLASAGVVVTKKRMRLVYWCVSTATVVLHHGPSPYSHFTVVPYYPYFRRGKTRGLVDNAVSPQEALNKAASQYIHVVNTTANSGWLVEQQSLTNMSTAELAESGAKTGLVVEYKRSSAPPQKIQPNQIPSGLDKMIDRTTVVLKNVTVPDAMRGTAGQETSGVAIQSRQFASQQGLAMPLDNLQHTRHLLARRMLRLIQRYYTDHRIVRITDEDPVTGQQRDGRLEFNQFDPSTGTFLNDLTLGEYDVVIAEQPMQITFDNTQFQQALDLRERGVNVPDATLVKHSNLADKADLLEALQQAAADPRRDAETAQLQAEAELMKQRAATEAARAQEFAAQATNRRVEAQYSAIQTAQTIAAVPQTAPLADALLLSAGYKDANAGPIVPQPGMQPGQPNALAAPPGAMPGPAPGGATDPTAIMPATPGDHTNPVTGTNPLTPANPDNPAVGLQHGIETPQEDM